MRLNCKKNDPLSVGGNELEDIEAFGLRQRGGKHHLAHPLQEVILPQFSPCTFSTLMNLLSY